MIPEHIDAQWERCRDWLLPALEDVTELELVQRLALGMAQLWAGERSAMVTALVSGEERRVVAWLAGGDLQEIVALTPGIEAWARAQGAQVACVHARKGWRKVLGKLGFVAIGDDLRKVL